MYFYYIVVSDSFNSLRLLIYLDIWNKGINWKNQAIEEPVHFNSIFSENLFHEWAVL